MKLAYGGSEGGYTTGNNEWRGKRKWNAMIHMFSSPVTTPCQFLSFVWCKTLIAKNFINTNMMHLVCNYAACLSDFLPSELQQNPCWNYFWKTTTTSSFFKSSWLSLRNFFLTFRRTSNTFLRTHLVGTFNSVPYVRTYAQFLGHYEPCMYHWFVKNDKKDLQTLDSEKWSQLLTL